MTMHLDIVSLFPEMSQALLSQSIIGRAQRKSIVTIRHINLRDYAEDERRTVDDSPFGGGAGMLLMPDVVFKCLDDLREAETRVVLMCPQGRRFTQETAVELSSAKHIVLFCGHYEGLDERARQCLFDDEISLGDFVLTNGILAASAIADAVIRLLPGALGDDESATEESFSDDLLLEYPHYTRPSRFRGMEVPGSLLSGNHSDIENWRKEQRLIRTAARRPDLLRRYFEN